MLGLKLFFCSSDMYQTYVNLREIRLEFVCECLPQRPVSFSKLVLKQPIQSLCCPNSSPLNKISNNLYTYSHFELSFLMIKIGGEGGIRTHGTVASTPDFESGTFVHSVTSPNVLEIEGVEG